MKHETHKLMRIDSVNEKWADQKKNNKSIAQSIERTELYSSTSVKEDYPLRVRRNFLSARIFSSLTVLFFPLFRDAGGINQTASHDNLENPSFLERVVVLRGTRPLDRREAGDDEQERERERKRNAKYRHKNDKGEREERAKGAEEIVVGPPLPRNE